MALLYKHQNELIKRNPKYWGLWWGCRSGKTRVALELSKKNCSRLLIVCTKSNRVDWERQIKQWIGTDDWCKIVSKEGLRRDWQELVADGYDGLILDEGHFFSGYKSQMHKNACKYLKKAKPRCVYVLTATPFQSTPFNVYCLEALLGHNPSWREYRDKYFNEVRMGHIVVPQVKPSAKHDLAKIIQRIGSVIKTEECLDLPEKVYKVETFVNTAEQKKALKQLADNPLCATHIVFFTKKHQISGGTMRLPESVEVITFKSDKLTRLKELAEEHLKLFVVARYNAEIELIAKAFEGQKQTWILNGKTPAEDRQRFIDEANRAEEGVFIANAAVSEGYNMPGLSTMVFYSSGFSYKDRVQIEGRVLLQDRRNFSLYIDLINTDSPDVDVKAALDRKEDFSFHLYAKEKERG